MSTRTLNEHEFPPKGGWFFRQPQTNWVNPMAMVGYDASRKAIRDHRLSNPAICKKYNLSTDLSVIGRELKMSVEARTGLTFEIPVVPQTSPSFFRQRSNQVVARVGVVAADIKRAAQGTAVVLDWLQSGGPPVTQDLANKRAQICVECPRNVPGSWYTVAPAEIIRETLSARSDLKLETPNDEKLKSCDVCKCLMRLKVWTPLEFILSKTNPEIMAEFPEACWIKNHDSK